VSTGILLKISKCRHDGIVIQYSRLRRKTVCFGKFQFSVKFPTRRCVSAETIGFSYLPYVINSLGSWRRFIFVLDFAKHFTEVAYGYRTPCVLLPSDPPRPPPTPTTETPVENVRATVNGTFLRVCLAGITDGRNTVEHSIVFEERFASKKIPIATSTIRGPRTVWTRENPREYFVSRSTAFVAAT